MSSTVTGNGNGRYVPMDLYIADRTEIKDALHEIAADVKAMRRELDRDDGREVAEDAAATAVSEARRSRGELFRDAGLCILAAVLAVAGTLITTAITGA